MSRISNYSILGITPAGRISVHASLCCPISHTFLSIVSPDIPLHTALCANPSIHSILFLVEDGQEIDMEATTLLPNDDRLVCVDCTKDFRVNWLRGTDTGNDYWELAGGFTTARRAVWSISDTKTLTPGFHTPSSHLTNTPQFVDSFFCIANAIQPIPQTLMMFNFKYIFLVGLAVATIASATCPGFNFGIIDTHQKVIDSNKWVVMDDSCDVVDSLITDENPCTQGIFSCGPGPVFDGYTSTNQYRPTLRVSPSIKPRSPWRNLNSKILDSDWNPAIIFDEQPLSWSSG
ncbi:hypothetical protein B0H13DRAFT_2676818 [Mycena leptocephala]|nr:hypothetical protein B0H13DRAFT_2676818 [Mycena leptocephala]